MGTLIVRLIGILLLIACLTSATACGRVINSQAKNKIRIQRTIASAAQYVGVPYKILIAVCFVESNHREDIGEIGDGNTYSYGICQVKLETAQFIDDVYKHEIPIDIERLQQTWINAFYAAKYLQYQYRRYGDWIKALEAYNKGHSGNEADKSEYVHKVLLALETQSRQ